MSETNTGKPPEEPLNLKGIVDGWLAGIDAVQQGLTDEFIPQNPLGDTHRNRGVCVTPDNAALVKANVLAKFASVAPEFLELQDQPKKDI